ncbi:MAG: ABC transporter substrate-binding protein [Proteobacteria bacterium]|jgi:ABC-type transport system substrate-binding protein|nr:ABC transporter substrate-binding protein [Pseudomonadota bacterium]
MLLALLATLAQASPLIFVEAELPTTFDPLRSTTMTDLRVHDLLFDKLFYSSAITSEPKSRLVYAKWLNGGASVQLRPREGVTWHDGKPLTAGDICFTVDTMLDPANRTEVTEPFATRLARCAVEDEAAIVHYTNPSGFSREWLDFYVLPAHAYPFGNAPVGTGQMRLKKRSKKGLRFQAHTSSAHAAKIDEMELRLASDPLDDVEALETNEIAGIIDVPLVVRHSLADSDDIDLVTIDLRSIWSLAINVGHGPLAKPQMRQGLEALLDRTALLPNVALHQDDLPLANFLTGPWCASSQFYNRSLKARSGADPGLAKARFEAAGLVLTEDGWTWGDTPFQLRLGVPEALEQRVPGVGDALATMVRDGGFDVVLRTLSAEDYLTARQGALAAELELLLLEWSLSDPQDVSPFLHTSGTYNPFHYSNAKVDEFLVGARTAGTNTESMDLSHHLHAHLNLELPYIFLWELRSQSAWRNEVRNATIAPRVYWTDLQGWRWEQ